MKETISITAIFQIVILFILLFAAIMALTINNSNAFSVKDQIVSLIEASDGNYLDDNNTNLSDDIVELITNTSYRSTGECDTGYTGYARNGTPVSSGQAASICIKEVNVTDGMDDYLTSLLGDTVATDDFVAGSYYSIVVFYRLEIPIVNQVYNLKTKGETKIIYG